MPWNFVELVWGFLRFCWGFCALRWLWPSPASSSPSSSPSPTTSCSPPSTREASSDLVSVDSQSVSIGLNWSQLVSVSILMQGTPRAFRLSLELDYYTGVCGYNISAATFQEISRNLPTTRIPNSSSSCTSNPSQMSQQNGDQERYYRSAGVKTTRICCLK